MNDWHLSDNCRKDGCILYHFNETDEIDRENQLCAFTLNYNRFFFKICFEREKYHVQCILDFVAFITYDKAFANSETSLPYPALEV